MSVEKNSGVASATGQRSRPLVFGTLAVIFLASRLMYILGGVRFDGDLLRNSWALLDPYLLQTDLFRSIFYLHSQPPLFNLFVGLVLKLGSANPMMTFRVLNMGMGLLLTFTLYETMSRLNVPFWLSVALTVGFVVSPATMLFENILFYTFPLAVALAVGALLLERYLRTNRLGFAWSFFAVLGAIVLTRSLFHPIWFLLMAGGLIFLQRRHRPQLLVGAAVPLLLITSWTVKNQVLFGTASGSSWLGMSMGKMVTAGVPESDRVRLVRERRLSPYALRKPFWNIGEYGDLLPRRDSTGIPALDMETRSIGNPNFNNIAYVGISDKFLSDVLVLIRLYPGIYFRGIAHAVFIFFRPSSDYAVFHVNRPSVERVERIVNMILMGQIHYGRAVFETNQGELDLAMQVQRTGILIVIVYISVILINLVTAWKCVRSRSRPDPQCIVSAFILCTILYVAVVGNAIEIGENNRFRYMVDPLFIILLASSLTRGYRDRLRRRSIRSGAVASQC
jgi:hypothetical protein